MMSEALLQLYAGNVRAVLFRLRQEGERSDFDVSAALSIRLTTQRKTTDSEIALPVIECDPDHAEADWSIGRVIAVVGRTVTDNVGSYRFALTMVTVTEEVTLMTGNLEVVSRPGWPLQETVEGTIDLLANVAGTLPVV